MKSILLINGSPRSNGNTSRIGQNLLTALRTIFEETGNTVNIETIELAKQDIRICKGCRICFDRGENFCPLMDDVPSISERIKQADILVFAAPVYVDDISGLMKTFLDRHAWMSHRPALWGKLALIVTTTGMAPSWNATNVLSGALRAWGAIVIGAVTFVTGARITTEMENRYTKKVYKLAGKMVKAVSNHRETKPGIAELVFFQVMKEAWRRSGETNSFDYQWWDQKKLLDKNLIWPTANTIPIPQRWLTLFLSALILRFLLK